MSKTYRGGELRALVHAWANDIIAQFTGQRGVFGARIAFAMTGKKGENRHHRMDGAGAERADPHELPLRAARLLTHRRPDRVHLVLDGWRRILWIVSAGRRRPRTPHLGVVPVSIPVQPGFPGAARWWLTLLLRGQRRAVQDRGFRRGRAGTAHQLTAIDLSASVSPDGSKIAFVSDRQGTPQIFLMPSSGGGAKRLTFQGTYNQTPRFCPRADTPSSRSPAATKRLVFDIFTYDLRTGKIERMTQKPGLERGSDLVAGLPAHRLHLQPRGPFRHESADQAGIPDLEGRRPRPVVCPAPAESR